MSPTSASFAKERKKKRKSDGLSLPLFFCSVRSNARVAVGNNVSRRRVSRGDVLGLAPRARDAPDSGRGRVHQEGRQAPVPGPG